MPVVYGTPAKHARSLRNRQLVRFATSATIAFAFAVFAFAAWRSSLPLVITSAAGVLAVAAFAVASAANVRLSQLGVGIGAERRVAQALVRARVDVVVHGARLGHGDIDHVAIGPVLASCETKYGRGRVEVRNHRVTVGGRVLRGDPLGQARANGALVSRAVGLPCTAVLVISEGDGDPFVADGVLVCSARTLPRVLAGSARVVPSGTADSVSGPLLR